MTRRLAIAGVLAVGCGSTTPPPSDAQRGDLNVPPMPPASAKSAPRTHPATRDDCVAIITANVDVQMQKMGITDPARIEATKRQMIEEGNVERCVGIAVSDLQIQCVREAKTAEDIDACLR